MMPGSLPPDASGAFRYGFPVLSAGHRRAGLVGASFSAYAVFHRHCTAKTGVARAGLFPKLTISASAGFRAIEARQRSAGVGAIAETRLIAEQFTLEPHPVAVIPTVAPTVSFVRPGCRGRRRIPRRNRRAPRHESLRPYPGPASGVAKVRWNSVGWSTERRAHQAAPCVGRWRCCAPPSAARPMRRAGLGPSPSAAPASGRLDPCLERPS